MRKTIKIKAFIILTAWLVIFAHSVIPHHHLQEQSVSCHDLVHDIGTERTLNDFSIDGNPSGHEKVCHFAGNLFQLVNLENFFYYYDNKILLEPLFLSGFLSNPYQDQYFQKPEKGTISLRAPPVL